jgi:hypothetical protein
MLTFSPEAEDLKLTLSASNRRCAMKTLFTILILCIFIPFFSLLLIAQSSEVIEKCSKVRITIHDRSDLQKLQFAGLSLEGMQVEEHSWN